MPHRIRSPGEVFVFLFSGFFLHYSYSHEVLHSSWKIGRLLSYWVPVTFQGRIVKHWGGVDLESSCLWTGKTDICMNVEGKNRLWRHFEDVKSPTKWPSKTLGLLHEYSDKFSGWHLLIPFSGWHGGWRYCRILTYTLYVSKKLYVSKNVIKKISSYLFVWFVCFFQS